jgi:hypothetical protein
LLWGGDKKRSALGERPVGKKNSSAKSQKVKRREQSKAKFRKNTKALVLNCTH